MFSGRVLYVLDLVVRITISSHIRTWDLVEASHLEDDPSFPLWRGEDCGKPFVVVRWERVWLTLQVGRFPLKIL
jgi:hypothetical protein